MKVMKKVIARLLAAVICCAVLGACANGEPAYKVTVVDALGNPYTSGVIVKFLQNGEQVAMQAIDGEGAVERTMAKGEYTVELQFTSSADQYYYEQTDLTLSGDKTELQIVLSHAVSAEPQKLFVQGKETQAYAVGVGCTYVELSQEDRSYFLFTPTEAGTYEFSLVGSDAAIGYYGAPHFVQEASAAEVVDNQFQISVSAGMIGTDSAGTTVLVVGVEASDSNGILAIERIGDAEKTLADEPWTVYEPTAQLEQYTLPAGAQIGEFDLTAPTSRYNLVYNETDGFYHLDSTDGPLVLVRLGNAAEVKYLAPFEKILESSGVSKYFFDEDGNFVKKENYADCLLEYIECVDEESGMYPLTQDLKYIIEQRGDHSGWWDPSGSLYLFKDENGNPVPGINNEIAWLFMCCYIK